VIDRIPKVLEECLQGGRIVCIEDDSALRVELACRAGKAGCPVLIVLRVPVTLDAALVQ
jgi:hypothetical protein